MFSIVVVMVMFAQTGVELALLNLSHNMMQSKMSSMLSSHGVWRVPV